MSKALFISKNDLVRYTPMSGNIDVDKVIQYVEIAQDIHIQQLLGTDLYNKCMQDVIDGTLANHYEILINNYVKPTLSQFAFLEFLPFAQYTIGNKGVYKHTSENAQVPNVEELDKMKEASRDTAQFYAQRIIDFLNHNSTAFPEYLSNTEEDMNPNRTGYNFGGWHI